MSTPKTHPLNVSYLVVGLVFLGIAGSWALRVGGVVDTADTRWLVPAVLLLAGAVGLVGFAAKGLSRSRQERQDADPAPYDTWPDDHRTTTNDTDSDTDTDTEPTTRIEGDHR